MNLSKIPEELYGKFDVIETVEGWKARVLRFDEKSNRYVVEQVSPKGKKTLMYCRDNGTWKKETPILQFKKQVIKATKIKRVMYQVAFKRPLNDLYETREEALMHCTGRYHIVEAVEVET